jgi:PAS domain S-box-containing protein/putative nucleotidyltransferase with HDIG domain
MTHIKQNHLVNELETLRQINEALKNEITEHERVINELEESENYYRAIFENTGTPLLTVENDMTILGANSEWEDSFGYTREELEGAKWPQLVSGDCLEKMQEYHRLRRIDPSGAPRRYHSCIKTKFGIIRDCLIIAAVIPGTTRSVLAVVDISDDHTISRPPSAQELELNLGKMQRMLMQTVDSLAAALETRDPYTAGHQKKVACLATAIAKEMGLSADKVEGVHVAGTLHDIGKIFVPSEILSKPGKISEIEYKLVQSHSQAGYEIIKNIEFPWPIAEIVLQHHERMNGSGYPQGLTGENILLEARILAVADVVEAISAHRPYRPALGIDVGLEEITKNKGILYDPEVVDACLILFKEKGYIFEV